VFWLSIEILIYTSNTTGMNDLKTVYTLRGTAAKSQYIWKFTDKEIKYIVFIA